MGNVNVSIIVPAYNCEQYLADTLTSILSQSYPYWECIIVNDGSTDSTADVAQSFCNKDSRFHYLSQENKGPALARNKAILNSSGELILPLDSDDTISESYLEKAAGYMTEHPETTLVYTKSDFFGEESGEWNLPKYNYEDFIWQNCICSCAMYRRKDYDKTTGYNSNMIYGDEDWDFWLSLLNCDSVVHRIDECLFHYRIRTGSRTVTSLTTNNDKAKKLIYNNHKDIYQSYLDEIVLMHEKYNVAVNQLHEMRQKYDSLHASWAYHIGKILLKPFSRIRHLSQ